MKTMTESWKTLNMLICNGHINPDDFYAMEVNTRGVHLQGHNDKQKIRKYKKLFSLKKSKSSIGWMDGQYGIIRIVLVKR